MATIETKFNIGDVVYKAWTTTVRKQHPCPDCNGSRKWKAVSPAGGEYEFGCPRCGGGYQSDRDLSLDYSEFAPSVQRLTIGSVRTNSASDDRSVEYMCRETGVGSGTIHSEADLFHTEEEAMRAAEVKAKAQNANTEWVVKQYDKSLSLSDYQIENAALKSAKDQKIRHSVDLQMLFGDLRDCVTIEEVTKTLDDFSFRDA